jgi:hypothetical protein
MLPSAHTSSREGPILLPLRFGAEEFQLRHLRFGIACSGVNLRPGQVALRRKLGSVKFDDRIARLERLTFASKYFLNSPRGTGSNVRLVNFDRAGNSTTGAVACAEEAK